MDAAGRLIGSEGALAGVTAALRDGRIAAVKGLGGYQLLADAASSDAVTRLRERKRRLVKPLAVMVGSLDEAEQLAHLDDVERRLLVDPAGPIVVVRRRVESLIATEIAPGFQSVGILLPTTPLHAQICDRVRRPLVCTSGNLEGEPLVYDERDAQDRLRGIADVWLHHDRPIARPIDDSVVRVIAGTPCVLRLARGYAPHVLPMDSRFYGGPLVAVGGEQKSAIALWNGSQAILGPHVGDVNDAATFDRWTEQLNALAGLYGIDPTSTEIVHDQHPDYPTTHWARGFHRSQAVQHHHAHIAAVLMEHHLLGREAIGLAWDGTGYGNDATVWGGECLRATMGDFRRAHYLRPFPLIGGERAIREPWRVAAALVRDALGPEQAAARAYDGASRDQVQACLQVAARPQLSTFTSSMGRLFDGVAALVLGKAAAGDEGRPAMLLEEVCDLSAAGTYAFACSDPSDQIDWRPPVREALADIERGESPGAVAMRFHRAVADLGAEIAGRYPDLPLVTSGGVFQNRVLGELLAERVADRASGWLRPLFVPPGDGGLAAGQLAVASARAIALGSRKD
jgi:hydrogenase maturation protein HypF